MLHEIIERRRRLDANRVREDVIDGARYKHDSLVRHLRQARERFKLIF